MADTVRKVSYRYTIIDNKAGEGFRLASTLREAGVNLLAFSAFPTEPGKAQAVMVPESEEALLQVAKSKGIELSPNKHAFLIEGADRPGAMAEILQKLSNASLNVVATDAVCAGSGRFGCILWVEPEDYDKAARALGA
ncbi:MAG: hypothetical protein V3U98_11240 [Acidobacteriota bacterium]